MDEPCSALDPISTARIEALVEELKQNYTIVIVTHNLQQAARASDFTAFMYLGELVEFDATARIFERPTQKMTEDYITDGTADRLALSDIRTCTDIRTSTCEGRLQQLDRHLTAVRTINLGYPP